MSSPAPPPRGRTPATVRAARWSATHPGKALGLWLALVAVAVMVSAVVAPKEASRDDLGTGSSGDATRMQNEAGLEDPASEQVLVTDRSGGTLDRSAATGAFGDVADRARALPEVAAVGDVTWSEDGRAAMLPITLRGDPDDADEHVAPLREVTADVAADAAAADPDLGLEQTGAGSLDAGIMDQVEDDLAKSETLSLPIALAVMLLAFGALIAAAIPVLLALSAVVTTFGLYALASYLVPDTGSVANMVLLIGMAVGVDYSLFFVKRQREERERGHTSVDAVEIAAHTAGHSILVSGLAVIVSVAGLLLVGNVVFSGLAVGAILVVAVAMLGSLTVVPAIVGKLGHWVDRPRIPLLWRLSRRSHPGAVSGRLVARVLRHPKRALALSGLVMLALAAPALTMNLRESSIEQMPRDIAAVETLGRLQAAFPSEGTDMTVLVQAPPGRVDAVERSLGDLERAAVASGDVVAGASSVTVADSLVDGRATVELAMHTPYSEGSDASRDAIDRLRHQLVPEELADLDGIAGVSYATGGDEAEAIDAADQQAGALPLVLVFVLGFTLVMMGVTFRSLGVALITLVLNLASVAAAFGLLALVFQHGWAESLLDFRSNGAIVSWIPMFLFVVLVGLSMDYHVLVLSRIREAAQRGASPLTAISWGVRQTAGPVSMAALVMVSVFGLFAAGSLVDMKQMGIGLAAAVLIDATIVRIVMLPALLALRGDVVDTMARRAKSPTGPPAAHDTPPTRELAPA